MKRKPTKPFEVSVLTGMNLLVFQDLWIEAAKGWVISVAFAGKSPIVPRILNCLAVNQQLAYLFLGQTEHARDLAMPESDRHRKWNSISDQHWGKRRHCHSIAQELFRCIWESAGFQGIQSSSESDLDLNFCWVLRMGPNSWPPENTWHIWHIHQDIAMCTGWCCGPNDGA